MSFLVQYLVVTSLFATLPCPAAPRVQDRPRPTGDADETEPRGSAAGVETLQASRTLRERLELLTREARNGSQAAVARLMELGEWGALDVYQPLTVATGEPATAVGHWVPWLVRGRTLALDSREDPAAARELRSFLEAIKTDDVQLPVVALYLAWMSTFSPEAGHFERWWSRADALIAGAASDELRGWALHARGSALQDPELAARGAEGPMPSLLRAWESFTRSGLNWEACFVGRQVLRLSISNSEEASRAFLPLAIEPVVLSDEDRPKLASLALGLGQALEAMGDRPLAIECLRARAKFLLPATTEGGDFGPAGAAYELAADLAERAGDLFQEALLRLYVATCRAHNRNSRLDAAGLQEMWGFHERLRAAGLQAQAEEWRSVCTEATQSVEWREQTRWMYGWRPGAANAGQIEEQVDRFEDGLYGLRAAFGLEGVQAVFGGVSGSSCSCAGGWVPPQLTGTSTWMPCFQCRK